MFGLLKKKNENLSASVNAEKLTIKNYQKKLAQFDQTRKRYLTLVSERKTDAAEAMISLLKLTGGKGNAGFLYQKTRDEIESLRAQIERDNSQIDAMVAEKKVEKREKERQITALNNELEQIAKKVKQIEFEVADIDKLTSELEKFRHRKMEAQIVKTSGTSGTLTKGEIVRFGRYCQSKAGYEKEPIEWTIKAVEGSKALLVSRYALDAKAYNKICVDINWEKCTLHAWLNQEFYTEAFSAEEQKLITVSTESADQSFEYSIRDKVFLLSAPEVNAYFSSNEERKCVPTEYAAARGAYTDNKYKVDGKSTVWWWLRSSRHYNNFAAFVYCDGTVSESGRSVNFDSICVRPALWVNIEQ